MSVRGEEVGEVYDLTEIHEGAAASVLRVL